MATKINKDDFGYLGPEFQYKLVKCFMEDPKFFGGIASIINQNSFTEPRLRTFVGTLKDYYAKESVVPSYDTLKICLKSTAKTENEVEEWDELIKKIHREVEIEGYSKVEELALKFFKQQAYTKIANTIIEHLKSGDLSRVDECEEMFEKASLIGQDDEFGYSPYDLLDKVLNNEYTVSIPTGIDLLDKALGGGIDKKKVGLIIGSAGFGKTTLSTAISSFASTHRCPFNNDDGFKVLQIYFEDDDVDISRKHFSRLTGTEAKDFKRLDKVQYDEIRSWIENFEDKEMLSKNLRLKHFGTGQKSASDIAIFIKRLMNTGFKPDLVIIDYFECLAPEKDGFSTDTAWDREKRTMRRIENMAKELDIAIWVTTQGNKGSFNSPDVVTMDQAGGSVTKIQIAQLVISIARSLEMQKNNRANLAVLKNRSGGSGDVFSNIYFDNGTSTVRCDDVEIFTQEEWKAEEQKQKEKNRINLVRELQSSDSIQYSIGPSNDDGLPF